MTDIVELVDLTASCAGTTIGSMPTRESFKPAVSFGAWLKYLRDLTGLTQDEAAKKANVSFDAVKRIERGKLVGSAHLLAWLSWLGNAANEAGHDDQIASDELDEQFNQWSDKALLLGMRIREAGLAQQPPKAKRGRAIPRGGVLHRHATDPVLPVPAQTGKTHTDTQRGNERVRDFIGTDGQTHSVSRPRGDNIRRATTDLVRLAGTTQQARQVGKPARPARATRRHVATPDAQKAGGRATPRKHRR